jgi:hypothetical protein
VGCLVLALLAGCSGNDPPDAKDAKDAKKSSSGSNSGKKQGDPIAVKDFPLPEGFKIVTTNAATKTIEMSGPNKLDDQVKYLETRLGEMGWKNDASKSDDLEGSKSSREFTKQGLEIYVELSIEGDGPEKGVISRARGEGLLFPEESK